MLSLSSVNFIVLVHTHLLRPHRVGSRMGPTERQGPLPLGRQPGQHRVRHHGSIDGLFSKVLVVGAYTAVFHMHQRMATLGHERQCSVWVGSLCASDCAYYWAHRLSHEVNVLWIGHVVHHQSEDYNLAVALRQSVLQKVLLMWVYWPLASHGIPARNLPDLHGGQPPVPILDPHRVDRPLGPLEWVMNTPSHHRVHHGRNPEYIDRNHAGVFHRLGPHVWHLSSRKSSSPLTGSPAPQRRLTPFTLSGSPWPTCGTTCAAYPVGGTVCAFCLRAPGWYPESVGGPQDPPAISGTEQKFNPQPHVHL